MYPAPVLTLVDPTYRYSSDGRMVKLEFVYGLRHHKKYTVSCDCVGDKLYQLVRNTSKQKIYVCVYDITGLGEISKQATGLSSATMIPIREMPLDLPYCDTRPLKIKVN